MIDKAGRVLTTSYPSLNLWIGVGISIFVHAALLSLHFTFPEASRAFQDRALEIILVNSRSSHRPTNAQALAQVNLDGGGDTDDDVRRASPLPASPYDQSGRELLEQSKQRVQALETKTQQMLTQKPGNTKVEPVPRKDASKREARPKAAHTGVSGLDLANNAREMARLEGEIARNTQLYNKRPRVKNIGTRAEEYRFAQYIEAVLVKIERVGTLNYPEDARGKLYGNLTLTIRVNSDGRVEKVEIDRSSGYKILDNAAIRIVKMSSPFAAFPNDIRRDTDILEITRILSFTKSDRIRTR